MITDQMFSAGINDTDTEIKKLKEENRILRLKIQDLTERMDRAEKDIDTLEST
jgi:predicted  nucleic acid-binding Zn-ribbon protein